MTKTEEREKNYARMTTLVELNIEKELLDKTGIRHRKYLIERAYEFALANFDEFERTIKINDRYTIEEAQKLIREGKL